MNHNTFCHALVTGMFLVSIGTVPAFGYRMLQNTTVGTISAGYQVPCYDAGGFAHWSSSNIYWYLNTSGQGSGKDTAIQNALASWTNVPNADHTLHYVGTTGAGWATDGQNTLVWASGNGCTGNCLALTALTLQSGQVIVEADVTFNSDPSWQTNGSDYDTEAVAVHEIGHTLGIHHTEQTVTPNPTMYAYYLGSTGRTLKSDDIAALQCAHSRYFAGSLPSPPPTPAFLQVRTTYCLGGVRLSWGSSAGATSYEVEHTYSGYPSWWWWIAYAGPDTSTSYDGGNGTSYYRVRACNAGGCSAYRDGDAAGYYYDPCL